MPLNKWIAGESMLLVEIRGARNMHWTEIDVGTLLFKGKYYNIYSIIYGIFYT